MRDNYYIEQLQRIQESEINFQISTFWDTGFTIKLGDEQNGIKAETTFVTLSTAEEWLILRVMEHFPDSVYAKIRATMINKIRTGLVDTEKITNYWLNLYIAGYEKRYPDLYTKLKGEIENPELPESIK